MGEEAGDGNTESHRTGVTSAFRHRDFTIFWFTALVSNTGSWMQNISVPFVLDQLTHSTAIVGLGAFLGTIPSLLVGPLAGSLADRHSRRAVLLWTQLVMLAAATALFVLWMSGVADVGNVLVCVLVSGAAQGLSLAALNAFVPQLVPIEDLGHAVQLNSLQFTGGRLAGPVLAGLVIAAWGPGAAFLANALSFVVAIGGLLLIAPRPVARSGRAEKVLEHFRVGVRYVRARRSLVLCVTTVLFLSLIGGGTLQLFEPYCRQVLHVGPTSFGFLFGVYSSGCVIGALVTGRFLRSRSTTAGLLTGVTCETGIALAPGYAWALVPALGMGFAFSMISIPLNTTLHSNVAEHLRGRVTAVYLMAIFFGGPVGALVGGVVAEGIGLRATFLGAAVVYALYIARVLTRPGGLHPLDETVAAVHESSENPGTPRTEEHP